MSLQGKVNTILSNYGLNKERFVDIYKYKEFNLGKDRENFNQTIPLEQDIIQQIEDDLMKEGQKKSGFKQQSKLNISKKKAENIEMGHANTATDVFGSLALEKKIVKQR